MTTRRQRPGSVKVLTLDRPEKRNAVDRATVDAIGRTVRQVEANPDVRVLVVTGAGSVSCAGMDLSQVRSTLPARSEDTESFMQFLQRGAASPWLPRSTGARWRAASS